MQSYEKKYEGREEEIRADLQAGLTIPEMQDKYGMASYNGAIRMAQRLTGNPDISLHNATGPRTARDAAALLGVEVIRLVVEMSARIKELEAELEERGKRDHSQDTETRMSLEGLRQIMEIARTR